MKNIGYAVWLILAISFVGDGVLIGNGFAQETRDCSTPGCEFSFHPCEFNPSGPFKGTDGVKYPNDFAKTFYCDAPWRIASLDDTIPVYFQIEGTDADSLNELHCVAIYDVSDGSSPPAPEESFWGDYQYTPDHSSQVYKAECGGCELYRETSGMYWMVADSFLNDGTNHGVQPDGTALTARNLGYTEADLGKCITLTVRIIYEESLNWTDIHDQDLKIYLGHGDLPRLDDFYLGDPHTHTWSTYYFLELGARGPTMFESMQVCGLDWELVTDHGYNMTATKWNTVTSECAQGTVPGQFIALRGEECDDGYTLGDAHHILGFGLTDWIDSYASSPPYLDTVAGIDGQGGFCYGAHTSSDGWLWSDQEVRDALAFDSFRGVEDYNERNAYSSGDTLHPWGSAPHTGSFDTAVTDWDADFLAGLQRWDLLLSENLVQPRHEIFFLGGSDAHGSMNYHVNWGVIKRDVLYTAFSNALGKVRNAVYCPGGLTQPLLLDAIYNGRLVVTDGPMLALGVTLAGAAESYGDCDLKMADTGSVFADDTSARVYLTWRSSADYGPVRRIRVFVGDEVTGGVPRMVYDFTPADGMAGTDVGLAVSDLLQSAYDDGDSVPDLYVRAIAYTYDPDIGADAPGDVSNFGYNPAVNAYQYRAVTNPIWLNVEAAPTPTPVPETGVLHGQVQLERPGQTSPGPGFSVGLDVAFCAGGSAAVSDTVVTGEDGAFALEAPAGSYDLLIKGAHTLAVKTAGVTIPAGGDTEIVDCGLLPEGDANGDNSVTSLDFFILRDAYNTSEGDAAYNPQADFDDNGLVVSTDFFLMQWHYNLTGEDCSD